MLEEDSTAKPPYVPFGTFRNFVEMFRENGVPDVIDRSLMRHLSGTTQSMLASALRSMGFVDTSGRPTNRFRTYLSGEVSDQKRSILDGLRECYSAVFSHQTPLTKMTQGQFDEVLRASYGFTNSTIDKAASFFLAAVAETGLEVGNHLLKRKATATRKRAQRRDRKIDASAVAEVPSVNEAVSMDAAVSKPLPYQLLDLLREPDFAEAHKQAVWELVQYLMERERGISRGE